MEYIIPNAKTFTITTTTTRILLLLYLGCGFITAVHGTVILSDGYYRIQNFYQGSGKSLTSTVNYLIMATTKYYATPGQIWKIDNHPTNPDVITIKSSRGQFLTMPPDRDPSLRKPEGEDPQEDSDNVEFFQLIPSGRIPGIYGLVSSADPARCVGLRTTSQMELQSLPNKDYSGNYWLFEEIQKEDEEELVMRPSGGPTSETLLVNSGDGGTSDGQEADVPLVSSAAMEVEETTHSHTDDTSTIPTVTDFVVNAGVSDDVPTVTDFNYIGGVNMTLPDWKYFINNYLLGPTRFLSVRNDSLILAEADINITDQIWTLTNHPTETGVIKLESSIGYTLHISNNYSETSVKFSNETYGDEWFKLLLSPDVAGILRLVSPDNPTKCLGVQSITLSEVVTLENRDNLGNYWRFEPLVWEEQTNHSSFFTLESVSPFTLETTTSSNDSSLLSMAFTNPPVTNAPLPTTTNSTVSSATSETTNSMSGRNVSILNGAYRIRNMFLGPQRSLTSSSRWPFMNQTMPGQSNQVWLVTNHPLMLNVIRLTSFENQSLSLPSGGEPSLSNPGSDGYEVWFLLEPHPYEPDMWRLDSLGTPDRCLGVVNDTEPELQTMSKQNDSRSNYWSFEAVEPIAGFSDPHSPLKTEDLDDDSVKITANNSRVPDGRYRVFNYFQGLSRSLAGSSSPNMFQAEDSSNDQIWTINNHPTIPDVIKLTSYGGKVLSLAKGGRPLLAEKSSGDDEWFNLVNSPSTPKIWRLDSMVDPQVCIGVVAMTQWKLTPLPNDDLAGNYWLFSNVDSPTTLSSKLFFKDSSSVSPVLQTSRNSTTIDKKRKANKKMTLTEGQYRVGNIYQGLCRSLSGTKMVKTEHKIDQVWTVTKHHKWRSLVKLTNPKGQTLMIPRGEQPSLSAKNLAENVGGRPPYPDHRDWFQLVPGRSSVVNDFSYYRLVSMADNKTCLGVESMSGNDLTATLNVDQFQNYWVLDPWEQLTMIVPPRFSHFYKKYINLHGISILSSDIVPDSAVYQAYFIARHMLSVSTDVLATMVSNRAILAVIGAEEETTDIPAHRFLNSTYWNARARGLGATLQVPTSSCCEENLLCYQFDKYVDEDITIHEFAHSMQNLGLNLAVRNFGQTVEALYWNAVDQGKYQSTYARKNSVEYFAEGVQDWFGVNVYSNPPDGLHNHVYDRASLKRYDPDLHDLLAKYFPADTNRCTCH